MIIKEKNLIGERYKMPYWAKDKGTGVIVCLGERATGTIAHPRPFKKKRLFRRSILTIAVRADQDGRIYECEYVPSRIYQLKMEVKGDTIKQAAEEAMKKSKEEYLMSPFK